MAKANQKSKRGQRRSYSEEFKQEAVQMLLDGNTASSVADAHNRGSERRGSVS